MPSRASRIAFFLIFAVTGFLFYRTMRPIFVWVGVGAFCAILTWRPYRRMIVALRGRRRAAAAICTAAVALTVVGPTVFLAYAAVDQGLALSAQFSSEAPTSPDEVDGLESLPKPLRAVARRIRAVVPITDEQAHATVSAAAQQAAASLGGIVSGVAGVVVGLFLAVLSLFYFYVDGEGWLRSAQRLIPLPERHTNAFFREFRSVTHAVFFGTIVTALLVGLLEALGFLLCGLPGALLLGAACFALAILPVVGSGLVWGPVAIWLALHDHPHAAIFLVAWCILWTLVLDHVMRPLITRGQLEMHPLIVFLSIFGGIAAFGFSGLLLGPLFAALFLAAVRIYASEFPRGIGILSDRSSSPPPPPAPPEAPEPVPMH